ncbi:MAG: DUF924 domain-containing protein [Hyphomicrobiales bacterium]|nr:DUF924 domain-containing protein [Hyphomicrobiales bacterium]MCP4998726.1 DUF924 domain-containing protein [Hyphomicrobiales bacterium]
MSGKETVKPETVISFWFEELTQEDWFTKSDALDQNIAERFAATHLALAANVSQEWRASPEAVLALIIVFDQFPRNIYRGTPLSFATDFLALREAKAAVEAGLDQQVELERRLFFYMPFEHSEELANQDRCIELIKALENEELLRYAHMHRDVIVEYGRFPHRNSILARDNTEEERAYLSKPGSGF